MAAYMLKTLPALISIKVVCLAFYFSIANAAPPPATQPGQVQPQDAAAAEKQERALKLLDDPNYFYRREGRIDPFMPFVSEETIKAEQAAVEVELTGMRRFEPGQLTLTSIVFVGKEAIAMAEDSVGKGYPLRIGTEIGRYGVVEDIQPNRVVIKQKIAYGGDDKVRYKTVEMILRKEGEQK